MRGCCVVLTGVLVALGSSAAWARFRKQELNIPGSVLSVAAGDLDADGLTDLVVSYRRGSGPKAARFMAVFFRGKEGYAERPTVAFRAPRNAAIFDVGPAFQDSGDQLLYLARTGVYAQSLASRKPKKPTALVRVSTLLAAPEEEDLGTWDFLRLRSGEPPVLIVPTRSGLKLYQPEGELWALWSTVSLRNQSYYDAGGLGYRRSARGGSTGRPYALRATVVVPNLVFVDQTGDQKSDLVTHFEDRVFVYPRLPSGKLSNKPAHKAWFSMRTQEELETRDAELAATVKDFDGDGVADLCLTKIAGGVTTLRSEVRFHRGRKGGGFEVRPSQTFKDDGFGVLPDFRDVDGDGVLEMLHLKAGVSVGALTQMMFSSSITLDLRVRKKAEAPLFFSRSTAQTLETNFGLDLSVGAALLGGYPIFGYDFDGDGRRDAILSQGGNKMVLHRGRAGRSLFEDEGHVTLSAPGSNKTLVLHPKSDGNGVPDVLVYYVGRPKLSQKLYVFRNLAGSRPAKP